MGESKADAFVGTVSSERVPGGVGGLREVLRREAEMAVRGEFVRSSVSYCSPLRREARYTAGPKEPDRGCGITRRS